MTQSPFAFPSIIRTTSPEMMCFSFDPDVIFCKQPVGHVMCFWHLSLSVHEFWTDSRCAEVHVWGFSGCQETGSEVFHPLRPEQGQLQYLRDSLCKCLLVYRTNPFVYSSCPSGERHISFPLFLSRLTYPLPSDLYWPLIPWIRLFFFISIYSKMYSIKRALPFLPTCHHAGSLVQEQQVWLGHLGSRGHCYWWDHLQSHETTNKLKNKWCYGT